MTDQNFNVFFLSLFLMLFTVNCQDGFLFEESIENTAQLPIDGRLPLSNHKECGENELFYPGNSGTDWFCDCKPGYIYFSKEDKCYPVYEQGPCKENQIFVLRKDGRTPRCKLNTCHVYGKVLYKKQCYKMGGPCRENNFMFYGVNETTLEFGCLLPGFGNQRMIDCANGSKKFVKGLCSTRSKN